MANIEVIHHSESDGYLKEVYDQILESRGKIAEIHKIQSLNPRTILRHMDLYMALMYGKSPLSRAEREMIGVAVSQANRCAYCVKHHGEALNHYWKDEKKLKNFIHDFRSANLDKRDLLLCELADISTRIPDSKKVQKYVKELKQSGITDRAILDTTLIISYFNFVNRIVLTLDVELESDPGGYKY